MFKINGKELEYDVFDADKMEAYEKAMQKVAEQMETLKKQKKQPTASQSIRQQCQAVSECFDSLFGQGTAQEIFDGRVNLKLSLQAFAELVEGVRCQQAELEAILKQMPNVKNGSQAALRAAQSE